MGSIVPEQNRFNKHFQGQRTVKNVRGIVDDVDDDEDY